MRIGGARQIGVIFLALFSVTPALAQVPGAVSPEEVRLAAILDRSLQAYEAVKDYRAVFYKQEEAQGGLGEREMIFLKFEKPFKLFMHWFDTRKKGLQVLYERGRHDGKLAIHKPGLLLGLAPVVFLDRNSPWVREGSESYDIEDAGIGTFLEDFSRMVQKGLDERTIRVEVTENAEEQTVDVRFPGTDPGSGYFAYRVVALFDGVTHLPVQMRLYDWKEKLTGIYEYRDLRLNVGPDDPEFKKVAERRLYKLFMPALPRPAKTKNF